MTEKKPCRWGPLIRQASVLGRFKNKLRLKKLEWKRFYEQIWGPTHPTADSEPEFHQDWETSYHTSEGSTNSNYNNSQYFDSLTPEEALELCQQAQIPTLQQVHYQQSAVPLIPSRFHQEFQGTQVGKQFVLDDGTDNNPLQNQELQTTPWMEHMVSFDSAPLSVSEYLDADDSVSEWQHLGEQMRMERNFSSALSVDSTGHMDGMMRDDGDSSAIPMRPEERLLWFKKFLDIEAEEALTGPRTPQGSRGWRVMVRIVCACRKLSRLLRMRKMEKNSSGQIIVKKRCRGFGENRSQIYKGVRRRNGKWVSEIRVGQTNEKVWLGSYDTEKEAALAFDAGRYHCSAKRCRSFNFPDSPRLLGPQKNLRNMSPKDRKKTIQRLAEDHAKACASQTL